MWNFHQINFLVCHYVNLQKIAIGFHMLMIQLNVTLVICMRHVQKSMKIVNLYLVRKNANMIMVRSTKYDSYNTFEIPAFLPSFSL